MSANFLKFKKRLQAIRIVRSVMFGLSCGMTLGGATLLLTKLAVIELEPIVSLYISLGALLIAGGLFFLFGGRSDKSLAKELDLKFDLKARVQTMIEFGGEDGEMIAMQRQDTDSVLSEIPTKAYKFKHLWIYVTAVLLSAFVLTSGLLVKDMRDYVPPEKIEPFELSELQEAGLGELIKYVEDSALEEEFRIPMAEELTSLLAKLRETKTKPDMQAALAETMAVLVDITYESSTATEMLNALWDTEDIYLRYLAKVLDTSSQSAPDWGDFAEKLTEYIAILMGDDKKAENEGENDENNPEQNTNDDNRLVGAEALKWAIESMTRKLDVALDASALPEDDEMYLAVYNIFNNQLVGLSGMLNTLDNTSDEEAREALKTSLNITSEQTFAAISLNKVNASVGEYAMTRLASLFLVPLPEFERPDFFKTGESVDGSQDSSKEDDDKEGTHDGGIGEGAIFGSRDPVLNPKTGEYVEYGKLINEYNTIMFERLQGDYYTEEQKEIIKEYFALLYSGLEEEGK